jgi:hypothetical protein
MTNKPFKEKELEKLNLLRTNDLLIKLKHLNDNQSLQAKIIKKLLLDILIHRLPEDEYKEIINII